MNLNIVAVVQNFRLRKRYQYFVCNNKHPLTNLNQMTTSLIAIINNIIKKINK